MPAPSRTRALAAVGVLAVLASCSSGSRDDVDGASADDAAGGFPITLANAYGETTVSEPPDRVASLGIGDADVLLALGVQPVLAGVWDGSTDTGIGEWAEPLVEGEAPTPLADATTDFSVEAVAASTPDLVIAVNNAIDETRYEQLSALAPTVLHAPDQEDWVLPWQDVTTRIGAAVGQQARAEQLVADTEDLIAQTAADNADLADRTGALVRVLDDGTLRVFSEQSARGQLLSALGVSMPESLADMFDGSLFFDLTAESLDLLDVDLLVVDDYADHEAQLAALPTFRRLPVVANDSVVGLDPVVSDAVAIPNPVTIPFVLDAFVEQIRATPAGAR